MVPHTNIGVEIPMTAKYYHRLRAFYIMTSFRLTVNSLAYFFFKIGLFLASFGYHSENLSPSFCGKRLISSKAPRYTREEKSGDIWLNQDAL
jgi:hypothetical protein